MKKILLALVSLTIVFANVNLVAYATEGVNDSETSEAVSNTDNGTSLDNGNSADDEEAEDDEDDDEDDEDEIDVDDEDDEDDEPEDNSLISENVQPDTSTTASEQNTSTNLGQSDLNEPLDNAVPIIYHYEVEGDGKIVPGESFKLKFTVYNPAVVSKVGNIMITVNDSQNLIYPDYGNTNSLYIGYLEPLSYRDGEISLVASQNITDKDLKVNVVLSYTDNYRTENLHQLLVLLPVLKEGKLHVEKVDFPTAMRVGTNNRLSLTYRNNGLSTINDVVLHIKGEGIKNKDIAFGSVGSGTSITSDAYFEILNEGSHNILVNFTYFDNTGKNYETEQQTYSVEALNSDDSVSSDITKKEMHRTLINRYVTYGMLLISFLVLFMYYLNKNRAWRVNRSKKKGDNK